MVFRRDENNREAAEAARIGIRAAQRVQDGQDVPGDWQVDGLAEEMIRDIAATKYEFTTDDIWEILEPEINAGRLQEPNERRILGAFIKRLESNGTIVSTEFNKASTRRNAAPIRVWRTSRNHAFGKWREWISEEPRIEAEDDEDVVIPLAPRVQDAKTNIDRTITENEQRIIRAQEDIMELRELIGKDQDHSASLAERGYNRGRMPDFQTATEQVKQLGDERERTWADNDRVIGGPPSMPGGMLGPPSDLLALQPYIDLMVQDLRSGEMVGGIRLASKSEDGSLGNSATEGLIGFQEIGISGLEPERIRAAVKSWLSQQNFYTGMDPFSGGGTSQGELELFPFQIEDGMLEREREQYRDVLNDLPENVLDGTSTWDDAMEENLLGSSDPELYVKYREEFPQGFMSEPNVWLAYSSAGRSAIIRLERDAKKGVEEAGNLLDQYYEIIDENLVDNHHYIDDRYLQEVQGRALRALKAGKITQEEHDWIHEQWEQYGSHAQWEGEFSNKELNIWDKANIPDMELGCAVGTYWAHLVNRERASDEDFNATPDPQKRNYMRRINGRGFQGSRKTLANKQVALHLAERVRNVNRYARVIPCSQGWRVYVGPARKV